MSGEATRQHPDSKNEGTERDAKNSTQQHGEQGKGMKQGQQGDQGNKQGQQTEQGNRPGQTPQQGDRQAPSTTDPNRKGTEKSGQMNDDKADTKRHDDHSKQPQR